MASGREIIAKVIQRAGWAFAIHLLMGLLLSGLCLWLTSGFDDASLSLRNTIADPLSIRLLLEEARGHFTGWILSSLSVSFVFTGLFLSVTETTRAASAARGRAALWLWFFLLVLGLSCTWGLFWLNVSRPEAAAALVSGNLAAIVAATVAGVFTAYYLGTALTVPLTMKPSVPLAVFLPKAWN